MSLSVKTQEHQLNNVTFESNQNKLHHCDCSMLPDIMNTLYFKVMDNGNLIFPPFQASDYKQEVHAQTYRCRAENELGRIQSRDVHVRAGKFS